MNKTGPGFLIAAAFVGPGTVTTATLAGAHYGYALLWAVLFSIVATMVLQEMAARLGVATGAGLAEALNKRFSQPLFKWSIISLIVCAIGIGNAAYEAGNLTGAAMGLTNLLGGEIQYWSLLLGIAAAAILYQGKFQTLLTILTLLVLLMSLVFLLTFFASDIQFNQLLSGLFVPSLPSAATITTIALIGTTVVPYNLFLHASLAAKFQTEKSHEQRLSLLRKDSLFAIGLGGLVTIAILSTAAATWFSQGIAPDMSNIAEQLRPLLGDFAPAFFALGLFAAGLTSAVTAPLATSYALCGALGWSVDLQSPRFRMIWLSVITIGTLLCFLSLKPLTAIMLAQASNGLLLPFIALCLLWFCNDAKVLGQWRNSGWQNLLGICIVLLVTGLGLYKVISLFS